MEEKKIIYPKILSKRQTLLFSATALRAEIATKKSNKDKKWLDKVKIKGIGSGAVKSLPLHLQQLMWDSLKIEPNLKYNYLAPPYQESLHNYGCAIDLSIIDISTNKPLNMGTEFDAFTKLSQPAYEWQFLKTNELTSEAFENRKLLRKVMQLAKFYPITSEWWHFNYCTKEQAMLRFELVK